MTRHGAVGGVEWGIAIQPGQNGVERTPPG